MAKKKFDDLYLIYEYEDDEPEVEVLFDGELLLTVSYDEAQELSELTDQQLERGAEYCREIHRCFDAWQAAEDNYAFENNEGRHYSLCKGVGLNRRAVSQPCGLEKYVGPRLPSWLLGD